MKPSNPARPARPAMMEETTSGTMIILRAWRKRSPRRVQILRVEFTQATSPACLSRVATKTAATSAMMICQWVANFFMGACYRYVRGCKKINFTLHFQVEEIDSAA